MRALYHWIDDRTGLGEAIGNLRAATVPGRACLCRSLPFALVFMFLVQGITGLFLLMYYSPGAQSAWESVYFLQHDVLGGWLLRAVHHYSGQAILVLVGIYLVGMILAGRYRPPREFVFWVVVFLGLVTLGSLLTGDLLAWDQNSQSATLVRVKFLTLLPVVGGDLFKLAAGGPSFGHLTLTRFLALHTVVLAGAFLGLLVAARLVRPSDQRGRPGERQSARAKHAPVAESGARQRRRLSGRARHRPACCRFRTASRATMPAWPSARRPTRATSTPPLGRNGPSWACTGSRTSFPAI